MSQQRVIIIRRDISGRGGAESYLRILAKGLARSGFDVVVLTASVAPGREDCDFDVVRLCASGLSGTAEFAKGARDWVCKNTGSRDAVISLDRNLCQDVLRLGDGIHAAWLRVRKEAGRLGWFDYFRHRVVLDLERGALSTRATGLVWANSHFVARQAVEHYGYPQERIRVLHNAVELDSWRARYDPGLRPKLGLPVSGGLALFVGSGWWRKGWDIAVSAVAAARRSGLDVSLVGVGRPGREPEFHRLCATGDWCHWAGQASQERLRDYFAAADCLLLPTRYDPFVNVTLEALASGLPVVTSRQNGAHEILPSSVDWAAVRSVHDGLSEWVSALLRVLATGKRQDYLNSCRELAGSLCLTRHIGKVVELIGEAKQFSTYERSKNLQKM